MVYMLTLGVYWCILMVNVIIYSIHGSYVNHHFFPGHVQVFKVRLHQRQAVLQAVATAFDAIRPGWHRQQPRLEDPLGFEAVPHQGPASRAWPSATGTYIGTGGIQHIFPKIEKIESQIETMSLKKPTFIRCCSSSLAHLKKIGPFAAPLVGIGW